MHSNGNAQLNNEGVVQKIEELKSAILDRKNLTKDMTPTIEALLSHLEPFRVPTKRNSTSKSNLQSSASTSKTVNSSEKLHRNSYASSSSRASESRLSLNDTVEFYQIADSATQPSEPATSQDAAVITTEVETSQKNNNADSSESEVDLSQLGEQQPETDINEKIEAALIKIIKETKRFSDIRTILEDPEIHHMPAVISAATEEIFVFLRSEQALCSESLTAEVFATLKRVIPLCVSLEEHLITLRKDTVSVPEKFEFILKSFNPENQGAAIRAYEKQQEIIKTKKQFKNLTDADKKILETDKRKLESEEKVLAYYLKTENMPELVFKYTQMREGKELACKELKLITEKIDDELNRSLWSIDSNYQPVIAYYNELLQHSEVESYDFGVAISNLKTFLQYSLKDMRKNQQQEILGKIKDTIQLRIRNLPENSIEIFSKLIELWQFSTVEDDADLADFLFQRVNYLVMWGKSNLTRLNETPFEMQVTIVKTLAIEAARASNSAYKEEFSKWFKELFNIPKTAPILATSIVESAVKEKTIVATFNHYLSQLEAEKPPAENVIRIALLQWLLHYVGREDRQELVDSLDAKLQELGLSNIIPQDPCTKVASLGVPLGDVSITPEEIASLKSSSSSRDRSVLASQLSLFKPAARSESSRNKESFNFNEVHAHIRELYNKITENIGQEQRSDLRLSA